MKVPYINKQSDHFLDPHNELWGQSGAGQFDLVPTPITMVEHLSSFMAMSTEHGKVDRIESRIAHNGKRISVHLSWEDKTRNDEIRDLDQFVDGVAVLFPLTDQADPMTMGDEKNPVNAWFWRANMADPFDVIAHGFGTSKRRSGKALGLTVTSAHANGRWSVVFQRALRAGMFSDQQVSFAPDKIAGISFAVWDGGNDDRSAQKSVSVEWEPLEIEA